MSVASVFISYPRDGLSGQALARELYRRLQMEGIEAFLDEEDIQPGDRWIQALKDGVGQSRVMLSVVSPAAHDRPWLEKEYIAASEEGIPVIPVLATAGRLPFQINNLQAVSLFGDDKEVQWRRLLNRIREYLGELPVPKPRTAEQRYLERLLRDNDERALYFASKVYAPLAGQYQKEQRRIAPACMSPRLLHRHRTESNEPLEGQGQATEHDNIITAFHEYGRLVLLGEPGAGKTFSLWRIAADYAQKALDQPGQLLPVVIPLNRWENPATTLHEFILEQLGELGVHFDALYQNQRLLPLLDALNEIPFDQRAQKLPQVRTWLDRYPTRRVLVTCRLRDYRGPLDLALDRLTIEPLEPVRIHAFLHNYFQESDAAHGQAATLFWLLAGGGANAAELG